MTKIYRKVYRDEVKAIGADAAYFLAELRAFAEFCKVNGYINPDGYFELSAAKVEEMTGFGEFKQKKIISAMVERGIVDRKCTAKKRYIKLMGLQMKPQKDNQGVANATPKGAKCNPIGCETQPHRVRNATPCLYIDKNIDKNVDKLFDEKQQQNIFEIVDSYFHDLGYPNETQEFMEYNRENFGEDHLTPNNYKTFVKRWIKRKGNPPKKKRASGRGKTAREVAESQGLTVDELLKNSGQPKTPETKPENIDPLITELFGG